MVKIVLADGQIHELRFGANGLCALEAKFGKPIGEIGKDLEKAGRRNSIQLSDIRAWLWAALLHENPSMTVEEAGDLIDLSKFRSLAEALFAAVSEAAAQVIRGSVN